MMVMLAGMITLSYYLLRYGWRGFRTEARNVPLILIYCVIMPFFAAIMEMGHNDLIYAYAFHYG